MNGRMRDTQVLRWFFVAIVMSCIPLSARAQGSGGAAPTGATQTPRVRAGGPTNSCAQIANIPSMLTRTPEGRSLIKMQRELSSVAASLAQAQEGESDLSNLRRVAMVRQDVDSLTRVYVRNMDTPPRMMPAPRGSDSTRAPMILKSDTGARIMVHGGDGTYTFTQSRKNALDEATRVQLENMIRDLEPRVAQITRPQQSSMTVSIVLSRTARAAGFIGITASGDVLTTNVNGEESVGYCEYPVVETVEDGSPADKAGIQSGDTLIAYNNHDLRAYDVNYGRLLIPGNTVHLRFRRAGKMREVPMVVARRPDNSSATSAAPCDDDEQRSLCDARLTAAVRGFLLPSPTGASPRVISGGALTGSAVPAVPSAQSSAGRRIRAGGAMVPLTISVTPGASLATFAGAQLSAISEAFAAKFGIEAGMLVMYVASPSAAFDAGLRDGDVIITVNGVAARDAVALQRAVTAKAAEHATTLQLAMPTAPSRAPLVNQPGVRTVVVRW